VYIFADPRDLWLRVGEVIRASGLCSEVFVTGKLSNACHRPDDARTAFGPRLSELRLAGVRTRRKKDPVSFAVEPLDQRDASLFGPHLYTGLQAM
jgi:hypothetical protein